MPIRKRALKVVPDIGFLQEESPNSGGIVVDNRHKCPYCRKAILNPAKDIRIKAGGETLFERPCPHCDRQVFYMILDERPDEGRRAMLFFRPIQFPAKKKAPLP